MQYLRRHSPKATAAPRWIAGTRVSSPIRARRTERPLVCARNAHVTSALQVDQHFHELGAGLKHLRIRCIITLCLDHGRKLFSNIHV